MKFHIATVGCKVPADNVSSGIMQCERNLRREFRRRSQVSRAVRMRSGVGNRVSVGMSVGAARPMMNGPLNAGLVQNQTFSHVVISFLFIYYFIFFLFFYLFIFCFISCILFSCTCLYEILNLIGATALSLIAVDWWLWTKSWTSVEAYLFILMHRCFFYDQFSLFHSGGAYM